MPAFRDDAGRAERGLEPLAKHYDSSDTWIYRGNRFE